MPTKKTDMNSHVKKWSKCKLCSIGCTAVKHVLFRGSVPATYLLIGEAPGPIEDAVGEPFVGPAGKVLTALIKEAGLVQGDYCITNVLACFPSREDDPTSFRKPKRDEAKSCSPRVKELIQLVNPKHIILLGNEARKYFNLFILSLEDAFGGFQTHDLRHPSFILRNGGIGSVEYKRNLIKLKGIIDGEIKKTKSLTQKKRDKQKNTTHKKVRRG